MANNQLGVIQKARNLVRRIDQRMKSSLIDDVPPGHRMAQGATPPSLKQMRALAERHTLSSVLPYEAYDDETKLFYNRDTVGFVLDAMPATGVAEETLSVLNGIFTQEASPGTVIQVQMYADNNIHAKLDAWAEYKTRIDDEEKREVFRRMGQKRKERLLDGRWNTLFESQPSMVRDYRLLISYVVPVPVGEASIDLSESAVEGLLRTRAALIATLQSAGIFAQAMNVSTFVNTLHGLINPTHGRPPVLEPDPMMPLRRQVVSEETLFMPDSGISTVCSDGERYSFIPFHVRQFPAAWAGFNNGELIGSFMNNILRIGCPFVITLTVLVPDQVSAKGVAQRKQVRATQMADSPVSKFVPEWKERKVDWDFTAKKVDQGERFLEAFYEIALLAPEGKEQAVEQNLKSTYSSLGWVLARSRYIPLHSYLNMLPMGLCQEAVDALRRFGHFSTRLSSTCTNIAPWVAEWKGTRSPMMTFVGRRGQLIYFSPYDNTKGNYNMTCTAASGAGKSFFTQEWISTTLGYGGRAFVIDAGHSYRDLCELMQGTYLDFGVGRPNLNPFTKLFDRSVRERIDNTDGLSMEEYIADHLPMLMMLLGQMANPKADLTPAQATALEKGIAMAIDDKGGAATITTVRDCCMTIKDPETGRISRAAKEVAEGLYPYTKDGMHGRYFEGENNIDLDNPFVVLELDALNAKGDLQSVVLLILMMQINQIMYLSANKRQPKLCIIDEAWRLLGSGRSGAFIEEGYRVARKHGGSFMTVTQKVGDYFTSDTAKAAYASSDFAIYLRQKPTELTGAVSAGQIDNTGGKVDVLRSLETIQGMYSEVAIDSPDGIAVGRFIVDKWTEKLYSTQPDEVAYIMEEKAKGRPLVDILDDMAGRSA